MWKNGQLVTLNGSVYRIHKCRYSSGYTACMFCQQVNGKPPCIARFDYPTEKTTFDLRKCYKNMPPMCIPRKVIPSSL